MLRLFQRTIGMLILAGAVTSALAFSLLGPLDTWQDNNIGYNIGGAIGGPQNLGEEYRWNIRTINYGFDESFLNYFGSQGHDAVNQAIAIMNNLPPVSQMSTDLSEFPTDVARVNFQASALGLLDLKSETMGLLLEEMGLASPERYVWTLRSERTFTVAGDQFTNYLVIKRNFDPVTLQPSSFVNGTLYTYSIQNLLLVGGGNFDDAVEAQVDPLQLGFTAVVTAADGAEWEPDSLPLGGFFIGLTRDDVGGLRYLYRPNNFNIEDVIPGTTASSVLPPWTPIGGTNTNTIVGVTLRTGVDKITFREAQYDSLLGTFITFTNQYTDTYVTNSTIKTQTTERVLTQPDILFSAADLGVIGDGPVLVARTPATAPTFVNNDALNGQANLNGPGVIQPQVVISFSKLGPSFFNQNPFFLDEASSFAFPVWGSFDGTTNPPVVYPLGSSIFDLERQVLGGP